MKAALLYVWQRRWCRLLIAGVVLCALPLLHPFARQSIFGPTIDGIPVCVYEDEVRAAADPDHGNHWVYKTLRKFGLISVQSVGLPSANGEAFEFYVRLAKDRDARVRRLALGKLADILPNRESEIISIFRHSLEDEDSLCRLVAIEGLWRNGKDPQIRNILLPMLDDGDQELRRSALNLVIAMARDAPELFEPLARLTNDADLTVRHNAIQSMRHFDAHGVPILEKALCDPNVTMRLCAIAGVPPEKHSEPLIPILLRLTKDPNAQVSRDAANALYIMNPKRFAKPATWLDDPAP
ncbi:MAG: HEAT repeat domain-containing protein [Planctomycetes bacterium]|nr:HEAT repeat domain-containing protein [Planctomycetota bacterium]